MTIYQLHFQPGTMGKEVSGQIPPNLGSLYCVTDELKSKMHASPVTISNGLAWSVEDNAVYYIDTATYQVVGYDYDPHNGTIGL